MRKQAQDTTAKLADVEAKMRRWHSRLTRASNMIAKLERQRRRLALQQMVGVGAPRPKAKPPVNDVTDIPFAEMTGADLAKDDDTLPSFLNRADPLIAEKMTAARKAAEEAARHKMPLSGSAAMAAIMAVPVTPKKPRKRKPTTKA